MQRKVGFAILIQTIEVGKHRVFPCAIVEIIGVVFCRKREIQGIRWHQRQPQLLRKQLRTSLHGTNFKRINVILRPISHV